MMTAKVFLDIAGFASLLGPSKGLRGGGEPP